MKGSLSVVIPGYNTPEAWWRRSVASVLAALGDGDEVIVVDDGSARDAPQPSWFGDARVRVLRLPRNGGQSVARNAGIEAARGEWIAFADSDDEVVPEAYREILDARTDGVDIVVFGVRVVWTAEGLFKEDVPRARPPGPLSLSDVETLFSGCLYEYTWNKIFRRSFLDGRKIRFDPGACPGEDTIFNLACTLGEAVCQFVPKVGYVYYRYFTSSLARYQKDFGRSLRVRNALWRQVSTRLGGGRPDVSTLGELTEREIAGWEAENAWRYDSPLSWREKWRLSGGLIGFARMFAKSFLRRHLYVRPIRRLKIRMMFPQAKEVR